MNVKTKINTDVLVIGGGGAACTAAVAAAGKGADVTLVSKGKIGSRRQHGALLQEEPPWS